MVDIRPEDLSRLLAKYAVHPLRSDEPAHVRLEASLQRLVDAGLMTSPDYDADPDARHELTADGKRVALRMLNGPPRCSTCRYAEGLGHVAALCMFDVPRAIRADGSGFCSWHEAIE